METQSGPHAKGINSDHAPISWRRTGGISTSCDDGAESDEGTVSRGRRCKRLLEGRCVLEQMMERTKFALRAFAVNRCTLLIDDAGGVNLNCVRLS